MELSTYQKAIENISTDVEILSNDGNIFKTHNFLLSTMSSVFSAMLNSEMKEGKNNKIVLNVPTSTLRGFYRIIYDETYIPENVDVCFELYQFYDKYDISAGKIIEWILERTNEYNIIDHFNKWFKYSNSNDTLIEKLALKLKDYVCYNTKVHFVCKSFQELHFYRLSENPLFVDCVEKIVKEHDSLSHSPIVRSECDVWKDKIVKSVQRFIDRVNDRSKSRIRWVDDFDDFEELDEFGDLMNDYLKTKHKSAGIKILGKVVDKVMNRYKIQKNEEREAFKEEILLRLFDIIEEQEHDINIFKFSNRLRQYDSFKQFFCDYQLSTIDKIELLYIKIKNISNVWKLDLSPRIYKIIFYNEESFKNQ